MQPKVRGLRCDSSLYSAMVSARTKSKRPEPAATRSGLLPLASAAWEDMLATPKTALGRALQGVALTVIEMIMVTLGVMLFVLVIMAIPGIAIGAGWLVAQWAPEWAANVTGLLVFYIEVGVVIWVLDSRQPKKPQEEATLGH